MNYYSHHIGDFNNETRHLSRVERSLYRDMRDMYLDTEAPLTKDFQMLCRKLMAKTDEEVTGVQQVLNEFFTDVEQGWSNVRCEQIIYEYRKGLGDKSAAGKASAEARAAAKAALEAASNNGSSTDVEQVLNKCSTNHKPITNNHKPITNKNHLSASRGKEYPPDFEEVWDEYPIRPGASKGDSLKAWKARIADGVDTQKILQGVRNYAAYVKAKGTEPEYIKQPATFFGPGEHYKADWTIHQARASPLGYESAKDKSRREASEKLTGRRPNESRDFIDITPGTALLG